MFFHRGSKAIIHQISEAFTQSVSNNIANFFGKDAFIFNAHVATILNGRNNRGIGRGSANTSLFQLLDQRGFRESSGGFGEVLLWH